MEVVYNKIQTCEKHVLMLSPYFHFFKRNCSFFFFRNLSLNTVYWIHHFDGRIQRTERSATNDQGQDEDCWTICTWHFHVGPAHTTTFPRYHIAVSNRCIILRLQQLNVQLRSPPTKLAARLQRVSLCPTASKGHTQLDHNYSAFSQNILCEYLFILVLDLLSKILRA